MAVNGVTFGLGALSRTDLRNLQRIIGTLRRAVGDVEP